MFLRFLLVFTLLWPAAVAFGQKIEITSAEYEVDKLKRRGLMTRIELEARDVERAWLRHLKAFGKVETGKGFYKMTGATIPAISPQPLSLYTRLESGSQGTLVFCAFDLGGEYITPTQAQYEQARRFLHDFAVQVYRDDMSQQITEADKAVDGAVRVHDRLMEGAQRIGTNLARSRAEHDRLLKAIQDNLAEQQKLQNDSARNRLDQETAVTEINRLRAISEDKKSKLAKIE